MNDSGHFNAPWSTSLKLISVAGSLLLAAVAATVLFVPAVPAFVRVLVLLTTLGLLAGSALWTVRGYEITPDGLFVQRLFWRTRIDLAGLRDARVDPEAIKGSVRLCGNGGLFSFSGWFRNRKLGLYRLAATNLGPGVVLEGRQRNWVVTPAEPEAFVREVRRKAGLA